MASQVLSGSSNPSYTNNTGQNVRILINYMASCTSMTWAGVTVTGTSSPVGKEVMTINGEMRQAILPMPTANSQPIGITSSVALGNPVFNSGYVNISGPMIGITYPPGYGLLYSDGLRTGGSSLTPNIFYIPLTVTRGGSFPSELVLSNGQSFSAVSGAYNIVVIREDGT